MLKKRFRAPRGGLHVNWKRPKKRTEGVSNRFFFLNPTPMKPRITRWLLAAIFFFFLKKKPPRGVLSFSLRLVHTNRTISVSSLHISAMAEINWLTVMGKRAAKNVLPTFHTPTASLPVVLLPATKDLLGTLGLETVSAPMDGSCLLHCAVKKLKEADSEEYAATTHVGANSEGQETVPSIPSE